MRKLILSIAVSLDNFIARPDGNLDWFLSDSAFEEEMLTLLSSVERMFFGRKSYQLLAPYWPGAGTAGAQAPGGFTTHEREVEFAHLMNTLPKTVFSSTLTEAAWGPVRIERQVDAAAIRTLKQQPGKDLVLFAGASLATAFAAQDLFDEYRIMIHPVLLNEGVALFGDLGAERVLQLQRTRVFPSGVALLQYGRQSP